VVWSSTAANRMANQPTPPQSNTQPATGDSAVLCFYLLGELRITWQGEPVALPPHRTHNLLAALLLSPHLQRRERLVGLLFPEMTESRGRRWLSDRLWLLRHSLPHLPIETHPHEVHLRRESRWLDVEAFQAAASGPRPEDWLQACFLYQADLLPSLYDDWLLEEREALYLQHVRLLHRTCTHLLQAQQFARALPLAERLVQTEPYDEQALRTLMRTYRQMGRRGAALAAYERFVALAADELGTEPEPASQALAQAIRHADFQLQPSPTPAPGASPASLLSRGRKAMLQGDRATAQDCLQKLRAASSGSDQTDACLLEVDIALFFEEYERAARLLDVCPAQRAPVLLRIAQKDLGKREIAAAHQAATEALILANEEGDRPLELEALLVLCQTQRLRGQPAQAARSAEQALNLARTCDSAAGTAQALIQKGRLQTRQGRYSEALLHFRQARTVALEQGLRRHLAEALQGLGLIQSYNCSLLDALSTLEEQLSIWRDLGMAGQEAHTLQILATVQAQLGRTAHSLRTLEQARDLLVKVGEPVGVAINQYHLAASLLYHDNALAAQAVDLATEAVAVFRAHEQPGWEAATLALLGYALWVASRYRQALEALQQAHTQHEELGELGVLPELLAYQGLAYLSLGELTSALHCTRQAVLSLAQGEVSDEVVPEIYCAHALALAATDHEEQARAYFDRAYQHLVALAAQFEDEAARQAFFHCNPTLRLLMKEVYARGIATPPRAGVIARALPALRGGRPVQVCWTVDAGPADAALKQAGGAIALRRARLSRLLQEAQAQGASPTVSQLADALGVSKRTIQRDLADTRDSPPAC